MSYTPYENKRFFDDNDDFCYEENLNVNGECINSNFYKLDCRKCPWFSSIYAGLNED